MYRLTIRASKDPVAKILCDLLASQFWNVDCWLFVYHYESICDMLETVCHNTTHDESKPFYPCITQMVWLFSVDTEYTIIHVRDFMSCHLTNFTLEASGERIVCHWLDKMRCVHFTDDKRCTPMKIQFVYQSLKWLSNQSWDLIVKIFERQFVIGWILSNQILFSKSRLHVVLRHKIVINLTLSNWNYLNMQKFWDTKSIFKSDVMQVIVVKRHIFIKRRLLTWINWC